MVDNLDLVGVVVGAPLGGTDECPSERSVLLMPATVTSVGAACFLNTVSSLDENIFLLPDSAAVMLGVVILLGTLSLSSRVFVWSSTKC